MQLKLVRVVLPGERHARALLPEGLGLTIEHDHVALEQAAAYTERGHLTARQHPLENDGAAAQRAERHGDRGAIDGVVHDLVPHQDVVRVGLHLGLADNEQRLHVVRVAEVVDRHEARVVDGRDAVFRRASAQRLRDRGVGFRPIRFGERLQQEARYLGLRCIRRLALPHRIEEALLDHDRAEQTAVDQPGLDAPDRAGGDEQSDDDEKDAEASAKRTLGVGGPAELLGDRAPAYRHGEHDRAQAESVGNDVRNALTRVSREHNGEDESVGRTATGEHRPEGEAEQHAARRAGFAHGAISEGSRRRLQPHPARDGVPDFRECQRGADEGDQASRDDQPHIARHAEQGRGCLDKQGECDNGDGEAADHNVGRTPVSRRRPREHHRQQR